MRQNIECKVKIPIANGNVAVAKRGQLNLKQCVSSKQMSVTTEIINKWTAKIRKPTLIPKERET
jgi:DNA-binding transcriptional regulator YiaG